MIIEDINQKNLLICFESYLKCLDRNIVDRVPMGFIHPNYDIKIYLALALLNYKHKIKTQYSCQGNHSKTVSRGYILLKNGYDFPTSLKEILNDGNIKVLEIEDYDNNGIKIENQFRKTIHSCELKSIPENYHSLIKANNSFVHLLNNWVDLELIELSKNETFQESLKVKSINRDQLIFPKTKSFFELLIDFQKKGNMYE